jgi:hypothetical protein
MLIEENSSELNDNKTRMQFLSKVNEDESEEIKILEYLSKDVDNDMVWKFSCFYSNQGLTAPDHRDNNGSNFMLKKEWENGEFTADLNLSGKDNPDYVGLLDNLDKEHDYSYPPDLNHCCSHLTMGSFMRSFLHLKRSFLRIYHHHFVRM